MAECRADQLGRDVNNLNHFFIRHAHWANHAHCANDLAVHLIGCGDHRSLLVGYDLAFTANVDPHTLGTAGHIQQLHKLGFLLEKIKQFAKIAHVA